MNKVESGRTGRRSVVLPRVLRVAVLLPIVMLSIPKPALANIAGGGNGTGPNVTVTDNGNGTVTMANGVVSIILEKTQSRLDSLKYTFNNSGTNQTVETLAGTGQYYYGGFFLGTTNGSATYTYTLAVDPASNGGDFADAKLVSATGTNGIMETHFSMMRGSPGFYSTAIMTHRAQDGPFGVTAFGVITRVAQLYNWLSADDTRNFFVGLLPTSHSSVNVPNAPHEISVDLNGGAAGKFDDKFIYAQDHADQKAWGWSSVGAGGLNIGKWMMTNLTFSDGGPMKRDVGSYIFNLLNNSILTGELGMGSDGNLAAGEIWTKTCGPWFIYCNNVSNTITDPTQAAQALFDDANAQYQAEAAAWPYSWFSNPNYTLAAGRGTVTGKINLSDAGDHNPTVAGTWVGIEEQPATSTATYDFQKWLKPYQYWTQTDSGGNFTLPNVIAGSNYTLWAYGKGIAGTFLSQNQSGGNPPLELDVPSTPFAVSVTAGGTTNLGTFTWTANRVGSTVFELGYPDRKADEFRHGEDFWSPELQPKLGFPTGVWGMQVLFPLDFPNGMNYTVGQSRWAEDWNYVLPSLPTTSGSFQSATGAITFNLATTPAAGAQASIYLGCAGDDGGNVVLSVNGANLGTASGVTSAPVALTATGYNPAYQDDSSIHFSDHGPFSDERITFPATMLRAGQNTLTINMNATGLTQYLMLDYLRLELSGYVPPPPASLTVYPGNNRNLLSWPVVPGATRYYYSRSTTSGSGYVSLGDVLGPVSGGDQGTETFTDKTAVNGTTYYYVVQSYNPSGTSANSPQSAGAMPSGGISSSAPAAPTGLAVTSSGHHSVAIGWSASPGANYYSVSRSTLYDNGTGNEITLRTNILNDYVKSLTYTDTTPSDGKTYSYSVKAISAGGTSGASASVQAIPLNAAPSSAPGLLAAVRLTGGTSIALSWSPVSDATGYVIYRSTQSGQFSFPGEYVNVTGESGYTDKNLSATTTYYYQVTAVNVTGVSAPATVSAP